MALLQATAPRGRLLGLDTDADAIGRARARLAVFAERCILVHTSFRRVAQVAAIHGFDNVNAIILDLGLSAYELADGGRGFSFQVAGPLDMRMDSSTPVTAAEIVNEWSEEELANTIYRYGEEPRSRRFARAIVAARPLHSTLELAEVISRAAGGRRGERIHPATRVFQALRIAVNDELDALQEALPQMVSLLAPGGRFAVISFHSLEDRIVKQFVQRESRDCICPPGLPVCMCGHRASLRPITHKPMQPGAAEIASNPRSRSAKLRIAERVGPSSP